MRQRLGAVGLVPHAGEEERNRVGRRAAQGDGQRHGAPALEQGVAAPRGGDRPGAPGEDPSLHRSSVQLVVTEQDVLKAGSTCRGRGASVCVRVGGGGDELWWIMKGARGWKAIPAAQSPSEPGK